MAPGANKMSVGLLLTGTSCALLMTIMIVMLTTGTSEANPVNAGKRFDCHGFCKLTGYHGMIGGCRCSFTLFSVKRSDPFWANNLMGNLHSTNGLTSQNKLKRDTAAPPFNIPIDDASIQSWLGHQQVIDEDDTR